LPLKRWDGISVKLILWLLMNYRSDVTYLFYELLPWHHLFPLCFMVVTSPVSFMNYGRDVTYVFLSAPAVTSLVSFMNYGRDVTCVLYEFDPWRHLCPLWIIAVTSLVYFMNWSRDVTRVLYELRSWRHLCSFCESRSRNRSCNNTKLKRRFASKMEQYATPHVRAQWEKQTPHRVQWQW